MYTPLILYHILELCSCYVLYLKWWYEGKVEILSWLNFNQKPFRSGVLHTFGSTFKCNQPLDNTRWITYNILTIMMCQNNGLHHLVVLTLMSNYHIIWFKYDMLKWNSSITYCLKSFEWSELKYKVCKANINFRTSLYHLLAI